MPSAGISKWLPLHKQAAPITVLLDQHREVTEGQARFLESISAFDHAILSVFKPRIWIYYTCAVAQRTE